MRPATLKRLRLALVGLGVALAALVWVSLRPRPEPSPEAGGPPPATQPGATQLDRVVFRSFEQGSQSFLLEAARWVHRADGQIDLEGVTTLRFEFVARGERQPATISARRGVYDPRVLKAVFEGDVRLLTADGFELRTERLVYRGSQGTARAGGPVSFARKDMSGSGRGLDYSAAEGTLEIENDFVLVIDDPDQPRTDISSRAATLDRASGRIRLRDEVRLVQGSDQVDSEWLNLFMSQDERVERAQFGGHVVWQGTGSSTLAGDAGLPLEGESRRLESVRLDIRFRPDRSMQEAVAGPAAVLFVGPGREGPREKRRLSARYLTFAFDDEGQLSALLGQGGSVYETEPLSPADGEALRLTCRRLVAHLESGARQVSRVEMDQEVRFAQGARRARAETGNYDADAGLLLLRGEPRLEDLEERSELFARDINIHTVTQGVTAAEHVRHVVRGGKVGPVGGGQDPIVVTSGNFHYLPELPAFVYFGGAVLRAGEDEIRATSIRLEGTPDARQLTAEGSVASRFGGDAAAGTGPIRATAEKMVYDSTRHEVVYEGDVVIRRDDVETRSPGAVLQLDEAASELVALDAGEPIALVFAQRHGGGRRGRYTPSDETMVLIGEDAWLRDAEQEVRGRALTFSLSDDTILIEGREQVRTEMLIREEP